MKLPSFMKINSHSRFEIRPRYYDERKERLEHLEKKYHGEHSRESAEARMKGSFRGSSMRNSSMKRTSSSNLTLLAIIVCLSLLAWYFLYK